MTYNNDWQLPFFLVCQWACFCLIGMTNNWMFWCWAAQHFVHDKFPSGDNKFYSYSQVKYLPWQHRCFRLCFKDSSWKPFLFLEVFLTHLTERRPGVKPHRRDYITSPSWPGNTSGSPWRSWKTLLGSGMLTWLACCHCDPTPDKRKKTD